MPEVYIIIPNGRAPGGGPFPYNRPIAIVVPDIPAVPDTDIPDVAERGVRPIPATARGLPEGLRPFAGVTSLARGAIPAVLGGAALDYGYDVFVEPYLFPVQGNPDPYLDLIGAGWTKVCEQTTACFAGAAGQRLPVNAQVHFLTGTACVSSCSQFGNPADFPAAVAANVVRIVLARKILTAGVWRWHAQQTWIRPGGAPDPVPFPNGQPNRVRSFRPEPEPSVLPNIDPMSEPVGQFQPMPRAIPVSRLPNVRHNPWRDAHEQPRFGPAPRTRVPPFVQVAPGIHVRPGENPAVVAQPSPRPPVLPPHIRRVPDKDTHERKFRTNGKFAAAAVGVAGAATEWGDFLDVVWSSIPPAFQTKRKGQQTSNRQKMDDVVNFWRFDGEGVDWGRFWNNFFWNFVRNEAGDRAGGAVGRLTRGANRRNPFFTNRGRGFATGPALR